MITVIDDSYLEDPLKIEHVDQQQYFDDKLDQTMEDGENAPPKYVHSWQIDPPEPDPEEVFMKDLNQNYLFGYLDIEHIPKSRLVNILIGISKYMDRYYFPDHRGDDQTETIYGDSNNGKCYVVKQLSDDDAAKYLMGEYLRSFQGGA